VRYPTLSWLPISFRAHVIDLHIVGVSYHNILVGCHT